jgi:enoyl-[acyl-carrier protein] reductase II
VRLLKNKFFEEVKLLEDKGASEEELVKLLGHGRARLGMLEGHLEEGELEVGQVAALVKDVPTVSELVERLVHEYKLAKQAAAEF